MTLRQQIFGRKVPPKSVMLWWLGQSGFILKSPSGSIIVLDPYLSNSCRKIGARMGVNMNRIVPAPLLPGDLAGIDAYFMTHSHEDHLDPDTILPYRRAGGRGPFVGPAETVERLHRIGVPEDEVQMIWPNKEIVVGDMRVRGTFAVPMGGDDMTHIGYVIFIAGGPTLYFTGDTRYHDVLGDCVAPHRPDVLITVINPFANLDPGQAAKLAKTLDVKVVIPSHYDMFPDNSLSPRLLRSNLILLGIGDRYCQLRHGKQYLYPPPARVRPSGGLPAAFEQE